MILTNNTQYVWLILPASVMITLVTLKYNTTRVKGDDDNKYTKRAEDYWNNKPTKSKLPI